MALVLTLGLMFISNHYIDDNNMINDIIVVSQKSVINSIKKKTTEWIQIYNDTLFKLAISQSASQIYSPQTKRPTQRDSDIKPLKNMKQD